VGIVGLDVFCERYRGFLTASKRITIFGTMKGTGDLFTWDIGCLVVGNGGFCS